MSKAYTKWLKQTIAEIQEHAELFPGDIDADHGKVLKALRIALASLEAEPIGFAFADDVDLMRKKIKVGGMLTVRHQGEVALYTAQPAPVSVPDDLEMKPILKDGNQIVGYEYEGGKVQHHSGMCMEYSYSHFPRRHASGG